MKISTLARALAVSGAALLALGPVLAAPPAFAAVDPGGSPGAVHYVDCDSTGPGAGTYADPLTTLASVAAIALEPGDAVLFKRGSTCEGALTTQGSGTAGAPIVIDAYGDAADALPHIAGGGVPAAVLLEDQEYWEIRNLEITNTDPAGSDRFTSVRRGLVVKNTDQGRLSHFRLEQLFIHDVTGENRKDLNGSGGIQLEVHPGSVPSWFDGVVIAGNRIENVNRSGINMSSAWMCRQEMAWDAAFCSAAERADHPWVPSTNLVIRDNVIDGAGGDGIVVQMNRGAVVEGNVVMDAANRPNQGSNAGLWAWNADDTVFRGNTVANTKRLAGNNDGTSFDIDYGTRNTVFEYNVSYGNEGGMAFYCGCSGSWLPAAGFASEGVYRYNVSIGEQNRSGFLSGATDGAFYNNAIVITDPGQSEFLSVNDSGSSVLFANNLVISTVAGMGATPDAAPNLLNWRHNAFYGAGSWPGTAADGNLYRGLDALPGSVRAEIDRLAAIDWTTVTGEIDVTSLGFEIPELAEAGIPVAEEGTRDLFGGLVPSCGVDIGIRQVTAPEAAACERPTALAADEVATIPVPATSTIRVSATLAPGARLTVRNEAGLEQPARAVSTDERVFAVVRTSADENSIELSCADGACADILVTTVADVVVDGSFESLETAFSDRRSSPWTQWNTGRTTTGASSGTHGLSLAPGGSGAGAELPGARVIPGGVYDLSAWVSAASSGPAGLAVGAKWGPGTVETGTAVNATATRTGVLEHVTARLSVPGDVDAVTLYCYQPPASGEASCDDITLTPVEPIEAAIARQPVSAVVPVGATGHLSLETAGSRPVTTQWQRSVAGGAWESVVVDRFGVAVAAASTVLSADPQPDARYRAVVTDAVTGASVISSEVTVTEGPAFISSDASLASLLIDGAPVAGFAADDLAYEARWGAAAPAVSATPAHSGATISITQATREVPTAAVVVTAADGTTTRTYTITFSTGVVVPPVTPTNPGTPTPTGPAPTAGPVAGSNGAGATGQRPAGGAAASAGTTRGTLSATGGVEAVAATVGIGAGVLALGLAFFAIGARRRRAAA